MTGVGLDARLSDAVGGKTGKAVEQAFGYRTVRELLAHYPRRYVERGELTALDALRPGEHVTVLAEVKTSSTRRMRQRKGFITEVTVTDGRGTLALTFFNTAWRGKELEPGRRGLFAGTVQVYRGTRQLAQPDYELLPEGADAAAAVDAFASTILPVYPATGKVPSWTVSRAVGIALDVLTPPADPLPEELRTRRRLLTFDAALRAVHRPQSRTDIARARERLVWDEALTLQVVLAQRRARASSTPATSRPARADGLLAAFDSRLPFTLTEGQRRIGAEVEADLARSSPMHRLLQGEVGSGKTLVALRAMLLVVDAGAQAALLAPTEVLAAQHARSLRALLGPLGAAGELGSAEDATRVALVTGSQSAATRRAALTEVEDGSAGIVVGTHALLEESVRFAELGLVVVDEQHRFGVEQRDLLRSKGAADGRPPHVLVMTATPIPRTVAMTVYGDLETSTLAELPGGRLPVETHVVPTDRPAYLERTWQRVREEVAAGRQAFVVCPRIGGDVPDDEDDPFWVELDGGPTVEQQESTARRSSAQPSRTAVLDLLPNLRDTLLPGLRVEVLHGRMPGEAKDAVMRAFAAGDVDVLLATTVVEVGVDVPNATVMVVVDAHAFGVSQLHQLRGRIGRGRHPGLCLLLTDTAVGTPGRERADAVAATSDGFALSRIDLEQRREGDVLGAAQSGRRSGLRLLRLLRDEDVVREAREEATALVAGDPALRLHPALAAAVEQALEPDRAEFLEKG